MGKRHRELRKSLKAECRRFGVREDEYGELRVRETKAQAMQRAIRSRIERHSAMLEILDLMQDRASEDLKRQIDEEIFGSIQAAIDMVTVSDVMES